MYPNKVEDVASKKNKNLLKLLLDVFFMNEVAIASLDDVIFWEGEETLELHQLEFPIHMVLGGQRYGSVFFLFPQQFYIQRCRLMQT